MMSLEFFNNQGVIKTKKEMKRIKKVQNNMIREEQYEEISEDESPYKKEFGNTVNRKAKQNVYDDGRYFEEEYSQDSFQIQPQ